jgi:hypothetical protein
MDYDELIVRKKYERHAVHDNVRYVCRPLGGGGFRCGKCQRGRIYLWTKSCAVCKSKIVNGM